MASSEDTSLTEIYEGLDALPEKVQKQIMRPALNAAGQVFEAALQQTVPHGETGALAQAITHKVVAKGGVGGIVIAGPAYMGGYTHTSQDPGVRAAFLEFGTRKMAPRPFMRRAFELSKQQAYDAAVSVIRSILKALPKG